MLLSHRSRVLTFFAMGVEYGCYGPEDRALAIAPLFHGAGFAFAIAPIFFGGYCAILPRFDPDEVMRLIAQLEITNTFMVPAHFHAVFGLGEAVLRSYDASALRTIISNAAPLPTGAEGTHRRPLWRGPAFRMLRVDGGRHCVEPAPA